MRCATVSFIMGMLLLIGIPARAENTGVAVGSSDLIADLDYSDTFTGTDAGGIAGRTPWGGYPVPIEGLAVEHCYDNPPAQWTEAMWSINADDNALPGATPWPGGSGAGTATGMTQSGNGGDWSIAYGLRTDFVVQMDAVQGNDRVDIWISATDSFFDTQALAVFFRGSDYAGTWGDIGIYHNGEHDSGLTSIAPIGEWHNFAVHFMLDEKKLEIFTDEVSLGVVDLAQILPDTVISNARVGCGWGRSGDDRMWTDNFQVGSRVAATKAAGPYPANRDEDVPRDVVLGWTPGKLADAHDVYLGTDYNDVNDADRAAGLGVLASENQESSSYRPAERLEFGRTYYWRIDEVIGAPENTTIKGNVWSFTTESYSIPITGIRATASSQDSNTTGPEKTVDGSGLNDADQHSTADGTMWRSAAGDPSPWIQYEFDKVYKLDRMLVWNSNGVVESFTGFGVKDASIQVSADGIAWTALENVPAFTQAPGKDGYEADTIIDFDGAAARMVRIDIESKHSGPVVAYGLSEVRILSIPTYAREPQPQAGHVTDGVDVQLGWRAGREAASHEVHFGTDAGALALIDTVTESTCAADALLYGVTYYWSVTEVNDAETPASYPGEVWSFTTPLYGVVDDFETYNDQEGQGTLIFESWLDGWGPDNNNGSTVGYEEAPFAEQTMVYSGKQSMPFSYDNRTEGMSEATLSFDAQDWTAGDVKTLSLMFFGTAGNTGQLYIKINGTQITYDGDVGDIARPQWQAWNIDLSSVSVNLKNVTSLTLGVAGATATGMLYVDAIRLYPQIGESITPAEPDAAGLVIHYEFEGTANDSSGQGHHGTAVGDPVFVAGTRGQGIDLDGLGQTVRIAHASALKPENAITISAWVRPDDITFNQYCEIYRKEDGNARQLLSFQEWGAILSFGIGVAGRYAELDAPIHPSDYTDGEWHLITATYDGSDKKVYADGGLIGRAAASGSIMTTGTADGYIGSWGGQGEWLDAQIDDFRFYSRALSPGEISWLAGRTTPVHKPF